MDHYTCEHVFQKLEEYIDRELTFQEMERVREHLETCALCASEHKFQTEVIQAVRERVQRISVASTLRQKINMALQKALVDLTAEQRN